MRTEKQQELYAKVLETIYTQRPISRVDIAAQTHITPATVGGITKELLTQNWIYEIGELTEHAVGRKKILLTVSSDSHYFAGLELSERHFYLVITDNLGKIVAQHDQLVEPTDSSYYTADYIGKLINDFIIKNNQYAVQAIGIALPGHFDRSDPNASTINTNNPIWQTINLKQLAEQLSLPVFYSNNAHCMVVAKRLFDKRTRNHNFIIFHVGRGMHCSYMYKGTIYSRSNPVIGEIGHTIVNPNGEYCECGKKGCLQTYSSNAWILKKAKLLYQNADNTYLRSLVNQDSDLKLDHILTAYELGDTGITTLIDTAIKYLVLSISNLTLLLDSEQIYLHGKLVSHPLLSQKILQALKNDVKVLNNQKMPDISVIPFSTFNAARGASALCIDELYLNYKTKYD